MLYNRPRPAGCLACKASARELALKRRDIDGLVNKVKWPPTPQCIFILVVIDNRIGLVLKLPLGVLVTYPLVVLFITVQKLIPGASVSTTPSSIGILSARNARLLLK